MYRQNIVSPDQALVHLSFHCCLKDGTLQESELDFLSSTFVAKGLNKNLDIKEEMQRYRSYVAHVENETAFLQFLIETINPKAKLALFAFCAEIIYRDGNVASSEEGLLNKIAGVLQLGANESLTIQKLIAEMNAVEKRNAF